MVNKVILIGNIGKDPEIKQAGESKVANFSIATSEKQKKDGEYKTITEWHNIVVWGKLADVVEKYVKKGSKIYVEGKLRTRSWGETEKKYITEILVNEIQLLDKKSEGEKAENKLDF
jgi:single-strand DNA-binding protein